ncbi:hypothetical protein SH2C18_37220 [Clostridium sediminicola]|uniref:DUF6773 family protein n=1 Tax=Clostridium sediminicola TaxID=3114879 RepID=UPI0031F21B45
MKIVDERVLQIKRKIYTRAFLVCLFALWGIIAYRQMILSQSLTEYIDILVLSCITTLLVVISLVRKGVFTSSQTYLIKNKKYTFVGEIAYFILFIVVFSFITGINAPLKLLVVLVLMLFVRYTPMFLSNMSEHIANQDIEE